MIGIFYYVQLMNTGKALAEHKDVVVVAQKDKQVKKDNMRKLEEDLRLSQVSTKPFIFLCYLTFLYKKPLEGPSTKDFFHS